MHRAALYSQPPKKNFFLSVFDYLVGDIPTDVSACALQLSMILGFFNGRKKIVGFHRAVFKLSYFLKWAIFIQYFYRSRSGKIRKSIVFCSSD
jgi:hypothetical protein